MTVQTRSLDKMRPQQLKKDRDLDGYFRELERILAQLGGSISSGTGTGTVSGSFAVLSAQLNGAISRLEAGPNLTWDCASITLDNDLITLDIA